MSTVRILAIATFVFVLFALAPVAGAQPAGGAVHQEPAGRFAVSVPSAWSAMDIDGRVLLRDPDGEIAVHALAVQAADAASGIEAAWRIVDPSFALEADAVARPPSVDGIDETVEIDYTAGPDRFVSASGRMVRGVAYVLLADGSVGAVARRGAQLQVIFSGLQIAARAEASLAGVEPRALTPELAAELDRYVATTLAAHDVPGAAVAVVQDGRVVHARGFGVRDRGGSEPVTPDTLMLIGSVTKSMTTMMMASLVDEGRLRWDTRAVDVWPSFALADPEATARVTMRDLVCACAGVPRRDLEWQFNAGSLAARDIVTSLAGFRFYTTIGEAFQYNNQLVAAGGYLAARAAGVAETDLDDGYVAQMQARVLDPIGMPSTTFSFERAGDALDRATPHGLTLTGESRAIPVADEAIVSAVAPAGGAWSTASDMARYLLAQVGRGTTVEGRRVVSAENLELTWQPQVAVSAGAGYGLGWFVDSYKGMRLIHHGGNTGGFTSEIAFLPQQGAGIVILTNARRANAFTEAVRTRLFELLFDQPMEHDAKARVAFESARGAMRRAGSGLRDGIDPVAVAPYLGTFANEALGAITIAMSDGRLTLDAGEFTGELRAFVDDGETAYVIYGPTLAGTAFQFGADERGAPVVVLVTATDRYVFARRG